MIGSIELWARVAEIFFATIFSVALVWVVIRIWTADEKQDDSGGNSGEKENTGGDR